MAASGNQLESQSSTIDVMPYDIWNFPKPLADIVAGYAWDNPLQKPFLFSDIDYTLDKILFLVEHSGPLDEFKSLVTRYIRKELAKNEQKNSLIDRTFTLDGMQGTLVQLLVSRLDITIRNQKGLEIDKGMAESFIDIVKELLPNRLTQIKEQIQIATPLEDEKDKLHRESANINELQKVFNAIKQNDEEITKQAIETFNTFVQNSKYRFMNNKGYLVDNRYYINLMHLIYSAFKILEGRAGELPAINALDWGGWYGKKADRFCFEIIGYLQSNLPSRMKQILRSGLYYLLIGIGKAERLIDPETFAAVDSNILGVNSYYEHTGIGPKSSSSGARYSTIDSFIKLMMSNETSIQRICQVQLVLTLPSSPGC